MLADATGTRRARDAARAAAEELERADVPEPAASAEILLSELLGIGRADLALHPEPLTPEQLSTYRAWISRRRQREPVQRILDYAYFRNLKLKLSKETLIPRPDTESVVEAALERLDRRGGVGRVLDLGTGSGAIAVSVAQERPRCAVHATDVSEEALEVARRNAKEAGVDVYFYRADLFSDLEELRDGVDLLVSNPPYIKSGDLRRLAPEVRNWDPSTALDGGPNGLGFYRRIFAEAPCVLKEGAEVVLEVGDGQEEAVLELGCRAGFVPLGVRPDLAGTPRAALLKWRPT